MDISDAVEDDRSLFFLKLATGDVVGLTTVYLLVATTNSGTLTRLTLRRRLPRGEGTDPLGYVGSDSSEDAPGEFSTADASDAGRGVHSEGLGDEPRGGTTTEAEDRLEGRMG
jgi:hypothetical protein